MWLEAATCRSRHSTPISEPSLCSPLPGLPLKPPSLCLHPGLYLVPVVAGMASLPSLASCLQGSCQQVPPSHFWLASVPLSLHPGVTQRTVQDPGGQAGTWISIPNLIPDCPLLWVPRLPPLSVTRPLPTLPPFRSWAPWEIALSASAEPPQEVKSPGPLWRRRRDRWGPEQVFSGRGACP